MTRLGGLIVLAVLSAACGGKAAEAPVPLPPVDLDGIAAIIDPIVAPLGYQVSRAGLIDRTTYESDPAGGHLAVYLRSSRELTPDAYAGDLIEIVRLLVPHVFERWSALESFDVCQEQYGSTETTPPPITLVDVTRDAAVSVSWRQLTLADLIVLGSTTDGIAVWARSPIRNSATWQSALDT